MARPRRTSPAFIVDQRYGSRHRLLGCQEKKRRAKSEGKADDRMSLVQTAARSSSISHGYFEMPPLAHLL